MMTSLSEWWDGTAPTPTTPTHARMSTTRAARLLCGLFPGDRVSNTQFDALCTLISATVESGCKISSLESTIANQQARIEALEARTPAAGGTLETGCGRVVGTIHHTGDDQ